MSYFTAKAREVFARAGGDPNNSVALADWAREALAQGDSHRGVIVARDGRVVAETRRTPSTAYACGGTYIMSVGDGIDPTEILCWEVGLALEALRRRVGQDVLHVRYWEVCQGAGQFVRPV